MIDLLPISIGIGLGVSLFLSEVFGLTAGGLVVPGYLALHLTEPLTVLVTVGAGFVAFAIVHFLSSVMILYGRRRIILLILVGYLTGMAIRYFLVTPTELEALQFSVIGFIIPGLIAIWFDRRGILETVCSLATTSIMVRLILILIFGMELNP